MDNRWSYTEHFPRIQRNRYPDHAHDNPQALGPSAIGQIHDVQVLDVADGRAQALFEAGQAPLRLPPGQPRMMCG